VGAEREGYSELRNLQGRYRPEDGGEEGKIEKKMGKN
jgi:hypothetical protein